MMASSFGIFQAVPAGGNNGGREASNPVFHSPRVICRATWHRAQKNLGELMSKYRVVFMERTDQFGENIESPVEYLMPQLSDGVVIDTEFVSRNQPEAQHSQEVLDEDDSFLSIGTEIWVYEIADGREQEFEDAARNSRMVIELERMDDTEMIGT